MRTIYTLLFSFLALVCYVQALPSQVSLESAELHSLMAREGDMGIWLTNKSAKEVTFNFYNNTWNGDGKAGANFDHPMDPPTILPAGKREFVTLDQYFKGRVQRGNTIPATWVEFQMMADDDGNAHGDVSLEQGCDGAATITPFGGGPTGGFTDDVVTNAPKEAKVKKEDGTEAVASTEGNWMGGPNQAAIDHLNAKVGQKKAYILGGTGVPDIMSEVLLERYRMVRC